MTAPPVPRGSPRCSGSPAPERYGPFWQVTTGNGVNLDFHDGDGGGDDFTPQHYAFLITEDEFDAIFARIVERGIDHYADPTAQRNGEINHHDGGRGTYFFSPDGHWLEIITRPYGSGELTPRRDASAYISSICGAYLAWTPRRLSLEVGSARRSRASTPRRSA